MPMRLVTIQLDFINTINFEVFVANRIVTKEERLHGLAVPLLFLFPRSVSSS